MNKEDYKAIAEIINNQRAIIGGDEMTSDRLSFLNQRVNILANDLANYFSVTDVELSHGARTFDRKQFLKDCGGEE